MTPRLLDLFCCAGGTSVGYSRAGFDVTGVDLAQHPGFPQPDLFGGEGLTFIQGDALTYLRDHGQEYDVITGSPPCQGYSAMHTRSCIPDCTTHPRLIEPLRELLAASGRPWVIENVVGAPLRDPLMLCGSMFGLGLGDAVLRRHRLFESSEPLVPPGPDACKSRKVVGVYGTGGAWTRTAPGGGGVKVSGADAALALGIDWTHRQAELSQAIPPAYTEHIGRQLIERVKP